MQDFNPDIIKNIYIPNTHSHKGENGKLMIVAGSILFHAASIWPLTVASRIVDMVYFSSVLANNKIVQKDKENFRNGIVISRKDLEKYVLEADCILIGPGLPRDDGHERLDDNTKNLTESLLLKYATKKWVIDGGSLQVIEPEILPNKSIITPNKKEFELLKLKIQNLKFKNTIQNLKLEEQVQIFAKEYNCVVLLKGEIDIVSNGLEIIRVAGGNQGMTKGGTGDVLAGLIASLYCKNDAYVAALSASYINKKASDSLFKKMGLYYNASDLANEVPVIMKELIL